MGHVDSLMGHLRQGMAAAETKRRKLTRESRRVSRRGVAGSRKAGEAWRRGGMATRESLCVVLQEIEHTLEPFTVCRVLQPAVLSVKTMSAVCDGNEIVFDPMPFQHFGHIHGLLVGNIRVLVAMQEEGWWAIFGHVTDRAEGVKGAGFLVRVVFGDFLRPTAFLFAVEEKLTAVIRTFGNGRAVNRLASFLLRHNRQLLIIE